MSSGARTTLGQWKRIPLAERLWPKVEKRGPDDCWPWTGSLGERGYGQINRPYDAERHNGEKRIFYTHRVAYELAVGTIPPDDPENGIRWTVDHTCHDPATCAGGHTCRHRACCNPAHLKLALNRDNILRGGSPPAVNARRTHCVHGHAFTPENTYEWRGGRYCRACRLRRNREWYARG